MKKMIQVVIDWRQGFSFRQSSLYNDPFDNSVSHWDPVVHVPPKKPSVYTLDISGNTPTSDLGHVGTKAPQYLLLQHSEFLAACREGSALKRFAFLEAIFPFCAKPDVSLQLAYVFELVSIELHGDELKRVTVSATLEVPTDQYGPLGIGK